MVLLITASAMAFVNLFALGYGHSFGWPLGLHYFPVVCDVCNYLCRNCQDGLEYKGCCECGVKRLEDRRMEGKLRQANMEVPRKIC